MYDDSDGWYDHQMPPVVNPSAVAASNTNNTDQLNGTWRLRTWRPPLRWDSREGAPMHNDSLSS